MTTEYDVRANLTLRDRGFQRSAMRAAERMQRIADRIRGARRAGGGLLGTLTRIGATYLGFHAITSAIRGAVGGMFSFQQQVEATQIGLQSILSAVDGITFEEAGRSAQAVWRALSTDALTSVATTQDLFQIFQGIVGPIRAAGNSLQTVRDLTRSTVSAATALGVDLPQAQRDIGLMVRGTAGMDTRLFSLLRSMGLITQETQEWNRSLTTQDRIRELQRALGSFDAAAAAYGESFAGATSSFKDIVQQLSGAMARPIFDRLRRYLLDINRWLIRNRSLVESYLARAGEAAARALDFVVSRGREAAMAIAGQWHTIAARFETVRDALVSAGPHLARLAAATAALSGLRSILGGSLSALASFMTALEGLGVGGGSAAATGGAGGAAGAAGGLTFGTVMAALGAVLVFVGGLVVSLTEYWYYWAQILEPLLVVLRQLGAELMAVAMLIWEVLRPVLKVLGTYIMITLVVGLYAFVAVLRIVVTVVHAIMAALAAFANLVETWIVDPLIQGVLSVGTWIAHYFGNLFGYVVNMGGGPGAKTGGGGRARGPGSSDGPTVDSALGDAMGAVPEERPQTVNHFHRGSVQVRQDFREADPDRVIVRMVDELNRAAVNRVASGFAPALSR